MFDKNSGVDRYGSKRGGTGVSVYDMSCDGNGEKGLFIDPRGLGILCVCIVGRSLEGCK